VVLVLMYLDSRFGAKVVESGRTLRKQSVLEYVRVVQLNSGVMPNLDADVGIITPIVESKILFIHLII
jgi:hypothetical protein